MWERIPSPCPVVLSKAQHGNPGSCLTPGAGACVHAGVPVPVGAFKRKRRFALYLASDVRCRPSPQDGIKKKGADKTLLGVGSHFLHVPLRWAELTTKISTRDSLASLFSPRQEPRSNLVPRPRPGGLHGQCTMLGGTCTLQQTK